MCVHVSMWVCMCVHVSVCMCVHAWVSFLGLLYGPQPGGSNQGTVSSAAWRLGVPTEAAAGLLPPGWPGTRGLAAPPPRPRLDAAGLLAILGLPRLPLSPVLPSFSHGGRPVCVSVSIFPLCQSH